MSSIRIGTIAALSIALGAAACGGNNATGTGGSGAGTAGTTGDAGTSGTAGTGGVAGTTGDGGTGGVGGTTGAGGSSPTGNGGSFMGTPDAAAPYPAMCAATVKNRGLCMTATDVQCANTCGPNKSGYKNCNCYSDVWDCPRCEYVPGDYSCYRLPDPLEACPTTESDGEVLLPMVGTACTRPACTPCGSSSLTSYRDSAGALKVGYCVCGTGQTWTCASTTEWPLSAPDAGS